MASSNNILSPTINSISGSSDTNENGPMVQVETKENVNFDCPRVFIDNISTGFRLIFGRDNDMEGCNGLNSK